MSSDPLAKPAGFNRKPTSRTQLSVSARASVVLSALGLLAACSGDATNISSPMNESNTSRSRKTPDTTTPAPSTPTTGNALAGATFWVNPYSNAKQTADAWRLTRPADATQMSKVAAGATARWIGNWNASVQSDVEAATTTITNAGALPLILEPDALAAMDCLSPTDQQLRLDLLKFAVQTFAAKGGIAIYLDAGHPRWHSAATMASRLISAGVSMTQGFSLNASNVLFTSDNVTYGSQIHPLWAESISLSTRGATDSGPLRTTSGATPTAVHSARDRRPPLAARW